MLYYYTMRLPTPLLSNIIRQVPLDIKRDFKMYHRLDTTRFKTIYDTIPKIAYDSIRGRNYRSLLEVPINNMKYMQFMVYNTTIHIFQKNSPVCRRYMVCWRHILSSTDTFEDSSFEPFYFEW